jgi:Ser/Thr protein kinase RdoA (MazF antagonist)
MPKASVDITTTSREEIVALLSDWGLGGQVGDFTKCYGGFSGSNYAVSLHDGRKLLLKCTNDQPKADVEAQVSALLFLRSASTAPPTCYPWPLGGGGSSCGSGGVAADYVSMRTGSPSIVLDFLAGGPADKVLASAGGAGAPVDVVRRIFGGAGGALAQLHSVALPPDAEVATAGIRDAGGAGRFPGADLAAACFVGQQPAFVAEFAGEASLEGHPFLPLHAESVGELVSTMQADVPRGFIHGDPFLDNLLSEADGSVVGWIDWEDVAVGPLMFDVGCAIIGCCYRSADGEDNALDVARIAAFLRAYVEVRALSPTESRLLLPFMRLALLCNATWRFRNFNLVHTGPETAEARDSYKELAERLTGLKQPEAISQVRGCWRASFAVTCAEKSYCLRFCARRLKGYLPTSNRR